MMNTNAASVPAKNAVAFYHLPGLFEFTGLYRAFLSLYQAHRDWFYDWCAIGSIYGAPADCIWGGGRIGAEACAPPAALTLTRAYGISARLTFSNSLLREEHLADRRCNAFCRMLEASREPQNGVIDSELLTDFGQLTRKLEREAFQYVAYMTKPAHQLKVREKISLSIALDLF